MKKKSMNLITAVAVLVVLSGAYVGFLNGHPAGFIQNFKTGFKENWKSSFSNLTNKNQEIEIKNIQENNNALKVNPLLFILQYRRK